MMCVPGVHAQAARGSSAPMTSATRTNPDKRKRRAAMSRAPSPDLRPASDAELAALALDRLAKIFHLRLDRLADPVACFLEELADRLPDLLGGDVLPEILALVGDPRRAATTGLRADLRPLVAGEPRPLRALAGRAQQR